MYPRSTTRWYARFTSSKELQCLGLVVLAPYPEGWIGRFVHLEQIPIESTHFPLIPRGHPTALARWGPRKRQSRWNASLFAVNALGPRFRGDERMIAARFNPTGFCSSTRPDRVPKQPVWLLFEFARHRLELWRKKFGRLF